MRFSGRMIFPIDAVVWIIERFKKESFTSNNSRKPGVAQTTTLKIAACIGWLLSILFQPLSCCVGGGLLMYLLFLSTGVGGGVGNNTVESCCSLFASFS